MLGVDVAAVVVAGAVGVAVVALVAVVAGVAAVEAGVALAAAAAGVVVNDAPVSASKAACNAAAVAGSTVVVVCARRLLPTRVARAQRISREKNFMRCYNAPVEHKLQDVI